MTAKSELEFRKWANEAQDVINMQCAQIENLTAALCKIADGDVHADGAAKFMEIAREALQRKAA